MDFIDDFIEEYRKNSCLWKANSSDFKNRSKRQEAYLKLIDIAAKHGEHYNVERTKQKINNLRCAFRHQLKKYNELQSKGLIDEPYCPKRKYFESLMFLKDEEKVDKKSKPPLSDTSSHCDRRQVPQIQGEKDFCFNGPCVKTYVAVHPESDSKTESATDIMQKQNNSASVYQQWQKPDEQKNILEENDMQIIFDYDKSFVSENYREIEPIKMLNTVNAPLSKTDVENIKEKVLNSDVPNSDLKKLIALVCRSIQDNSSEDIFSSFGKVVAHKLRTMDSSQAIFAEKLIADVLYQGQMKLLTSISINRFDYIDS